MSFKKILVVINVHFTVFKYDIFLCLQLICCAFCSVVQFSFWTHFKDKKQKDYKTRNKDYKIPLIYFVVTKILKRKVRIQITSTDHCSWRVYFHFFFETGRKLRIFSCRFSRLSFSIFLSFSDLIGSFCHCERV